MNQPIKPRIFTVGHGNASFQEIERILQMHSVATVVDVRSTPYSKYSPDFRKSALSASATTAGLGYRWMGDRLGGCLSEADPVDHAATRVDSPSFLGAIAEVIALNAGGPVVLLCAERDPEHCHRRVVLAPRLEALGIEVFHILPGGVAHRHQPSLGI